MNLSLMQLMLMSSSIFMLGTLSMISDQVYADPKPSHYKYSKNYHQPVHRGPVYRGPGHAVPAHRGYRYRNVNVIRRHGPVYRGYGYYHFDSHAYPWLAFTAISLKILDNVNEQQQRAHESAQIKAAAAPVGEKIIWNEGGATGSVTTIRDGSSSSGRYCREFQHEVTIAGKSERAYGTACRQPDGSWEVITSGTP